MKDDLSYLFKIIDCKQIFIKEYYIQLPFIIMRLIFHMAGEDDSIVARYLQKILWQLKIKSNILEKQDHDDDMDG